MKMSQNWTKTQVCDLDLPTKPLPLIINTIIQQNKLHYFINKIIINTTKHSHKQYNTLFINTSSQKKVSLFKSKVRALLSASIRASSWATSIVRVTPSIKASRFFLASNTRLSLGSQIATQHLPQLPSYP